MGQVNLGAGRPYLQVAAILFDEGGIPSTPDFCGGSLRGAEIQESPESGLSLTRVKSFPGLPDIRHSNLRSSHTQAFCGCPAEKSQFRHLYYTYRPSWVMTGYRRSYALPRVPTNPTTATIMTKKTPPDFQYVRVHIERERARREHPLYSVALSPTHKVNTYERTPRMRALRTPLYRQVPHFKDILDLVYSFCRIPLPSPHLDFSRGGSQPPFRLRVVH